MDVNGVVNLQYPRWTNVAPFSSFSGDADRSEKTTAEAKNGQQSRETSHQWST